MKTLPRVINIFLVLNIALTSPALIFAQEYGDTQDDPGQSSQSGFDYGTPYSYPTPNYATPGGYGADDPGGSTVEHYGTPSTPYSYPTPTYPTPVYPTPAYPSPYEAGDPGGDNNGWDTSVPDAETEPADTPAEENPDNYNNAFNEGFNAVYNGEALTCSSSACQQGKDAAAASIERQAAEQALVDQRRGERAGSNVNVREMDQGGGGFDLFGGVTGFVGGVFSGIGTVAHDTLDGVTGLLPDEGICLINCNQALNDQFNSDFNQGFNSVYTGGDLACQSDACRSGVAAATEVINHPPASAQVLGLTTEGYTNGLATTFGVEPGVTPEETVRRINLATTGKVGQTITAGSFKSKISAERGIKAVGIVLYKEASDNWSCPYPSPVVEGVKYCFIQAIDNPVGTTAEVLSKAWTPDKPGNYQVIIDVIDNTDKKCSGSHNRAVSDYDCGVDDAVNLNIN